MEATKDRVKEPLMWITKRDGMNPVFIWLIRVLAFVCGMLACGLIAFALIEQLRDEPSRITEFYKCFIDGVVKNDDMKWTFAKDVAILLCISVALTPAFRMRFWNTGAEGQTLVGVLAAVGVNFYLGEPYARSHVADARLLAPMLVAALLAGALWALIPALFKAKWNTNETLFTLMMNYVAIHLVSFCLAEWVPNGSNTISINDDMPTLFNGLAAVAKKNHKYSNYLTIILTVLTVTVLIYIYIKYTKHGYELNVVGESLRTAQYVGIKVKKVIIRTMLLSGMLCGLAGFLIGGVLDCTVNTESVGGQGFTGIMVAWLASFNPLIMILTSAIITFLNHGASQISTAFDISGALPNVMIGVVLFFVIGSEFFINYKLNFRKHAREVRA